MVDTLTSDDRQSAFDRDPAELARKFHVFGRVEAPQLDSPMYAELSYGVSHDAELIELATHTRLGQPPPNMLFAAAHYLLLSGESHDLRRHYPAITGEPRPPVPAFPAFRDFCLANRDRIASLLQTRITQTNVVQRCACLLPAFAEVERQTRQPLALLEIGPSAGLNLNWDRYRYTYVDAAEREVSTWGNAASPVRMTSSALGDSLPVPGDAIPVTWRMGIDMNPIDVDDADQMRWLQALIWPEHVERHARLRAAADVTRQHRPRLVAGDAVELLPEWLNQAPEAAALVVYATHVLYQIPPDRRIRLLKGLATFASNHERRVDLITLESTGGEDSQLAQHTYEHGGRTQRELARASPHGRWLRWTA